MENVPLFLNCVRQAVPKNLSTFTSSKIPCVIVDNVDPVNVPPRIVFVFKERLELSKILKLMPDIV